MNAKAIFKTVFSTALLVLLLLLAFHNRGVAVDFTLLPVLNQTFHGPIALMYFLFFCGGLLMGVVISMRTSRPDRRQAPPPADVTPAVPRIATGAEPRIGSRIS